MQRRGSHNKDTANQKALSACWDSHATRDFAVLASHLMRQIQRLLAQIHVRLMRSQRYVKVTWTSNVECLDQGRDAVPNGAVPYCLCR
jgi:hypothetical protein